MQGDDAGRRLAAELRQLRGLAGISGREFAQRIGVSQSTVSRIESNRLVPALPVVVAWAEAVGASVEKRETLQLLTEAAHSGVRRFHTVLREQPHLQDDIGHQEAQARVIRVFQPSVVPGLLQTAEYARRVFSLFHIPYSDEDLAAALAARMDRQLALYDETRRFEFLVTESALRWRPGPPGLLVAQLGRIATLSTLENLSFGVIPHDTEAITFLSHGFAIYDSENDDVPPVVSVESVHANLDVRAAEDVALYQERWALLQRMAIFGDAAEKFLAATADHIRAISR